MGIRVKNIKYFGSQPWPFPHSLMVGFTAEWARGEIRPDGKEIEDARWFTPDFLPDIHRPSAYPKTHRTLAHREEKIENTWEVEL